MNELEFLQDLEDSLNAGLFERKDDLKTTIRQRKILVKNNVDLASVSNCTCKDEAICDNCGEMATKVITGEICSKCYC